MARTVSRVEVVDYKFDAFILALQYYENYL